MTTLIKLFAKLALVASILSAGIAMAQSEPSINQIYATAQAGKLDEAQVMVQQVLVSHPKSAKAYFVQAELYARQGRLDAARQALTQAEQYSPGLPFAKPEAVQALNAQLAARPQAIPGAPFAAAQNGMHASNSWLLPVVLAGGFIAAAFFFFRKRTMESSLRPTYVPVNESGLIGLQSFGSTSGVQPAFPQPGYPQATYPQQPGSGLGGRIVGGVATGLAVGAGVMAAEAIGRNLMGGHASSSSQADVFSGSNSFEPIAPATNVDMGGNNFGINDTSWDDGSSVGSNDWDN